MTPPISPSSPKGIASKPKTTSPSNQNGIPSTILFSSQKNLTYPSTPISREDYNLESKKQDIMSLNSAINHLEYMIYLSFDGTSMLKLIANPDKIKNSSESKMHTKSFSNAIKHLSIKNGSLTDSYNNIPWELLRNLDEIIKKDSDLTKISSDLKKIQEEFRKIIQQEQSKDPALKSINLKNTSDMSSVYRAPNNNHKYKHADDPDEILSKYEGILFEGVRRNEFNDYIVLTKIEKIAYSYFLKKHKERLNTLSNELTSIEKVSSDKNMEAILAMAALAGEISKNFLIFERYIPKENRPIFREIKRLRDAIEHMIDYEETANFLQEQKKDAAFVKELIDLIHGFAKAMNELPNDAVYQKNNPDTKKIEKAGKAIMAITQSLPEGLREDKKIGLKLDLIKSAILWKYEFELLGDNFKKIYGENLIKLLKHDCTALNNWEGVEEGLQGKNKLKVADYNKLLAFSQKSIKKQTNQTKIQIFYFEYKKYLKEHGKKTSDINKQFDIITESLATINQLTSDLIKSNAAKNKSIRKACHEDRAYHYAVLFNLTLIGQAIQNLRSKEEFIINASFEVKKEFENLRKIRNSIAHDQFIDEAGSTLSYYGNDLINSPIQLDGGRAYDSQQYLESMRNLINDTKSLISFSYLDGVSELFSNFSLVNEEQYDANYNRYMLEELLEKAVAMKSSESCIDILCKIDRGIKDESRFFISALKHLNKIYYRNGLILQLMEECDNYSRSKSKDKYKFNSFQGILNKLEVDTNKFKNIEDYFNSAKRVIKNTSQKSDLLYHLEEAVRANNHKECKKILVELSVNTEESYSLLESYIERIKFKFNKPYVIKTEVHKTFERGTKKSKEYMEHSKLEPSLNTINHDEQDLAEIQQAEEKGDRKQLLEKIKKHHHHIIYPIGEAEKYLDKKPMLKVKKLYDNRIKIDELCKKHNITIDGIWGDILKYSWSYGHNMLLLIDSNNPHNTAKFKQEFCALFGMHLIIITECDLKEYLEKEGYSHKFDQRLKNIKQCQLSHLQNGYELYEAVLDRDEKKVTQILKNKRDETSLDINIEGYTPLHSACKEYARGLHVGKSLEIAQLLLEAGANPNLPDKHGNNMLHNAALDGSLELAQLAIQYGVKPLGKNRAKKTAMEIAADHQYSGVHNYLLSITDIEPIEKLSDAIKLGDLGSVTKLCREKIDLNQKTKKGELLLNIACRADHDKRLEIIKLLLNNNTNVNGIDDSGNSIDNALYQNYSESTFDIIVLLLTKGAQISNKSLDNSLYCEGLRIMQLLIEKGADINAIVSGSTPVLSLLNMNYGNFRQNKCIEKLKILIDVGADLYIQNERGGNALHQATERGHTEAVKLILKAGIDTRVKSDGTSFRGKTALEIAQQEGHKDIVTLLLNKKA